MAIKKVTTAKEEGKRVLAAMLQDRRITINAFIKFDAKLMFAYNPAEVKKIMKQAEKSIIDGRKKKIVIVEQPTEIINVEEIDEIEQAENTIRKRALHAFKCVVPERMASDSARSLKYLQKAISKGVEDIFATFSPFKVSVDVSIIMTKQVNVEGVDVNEEQTKYANCVRAVPCHSMNEVNKALENFNLKFFESIEKLTQQSSGWVLSSILYAYVSLYKIQNMRGSSFIPLPEQLKNAKFGLINIKNVDRECFKWCMLYHQTKKAKNDDRLSVLQKVVNKYDFTGVEFPVGMDDISMFESNNENVSVNIFQYDGCDENGNIISTVKRSVTGGFNIINLLLLKDEITGLEHYVYIKKLGSIFKCHDTNGKELCERCLMRYNPDKEHTCNIDCNFETTVNYLDSDDRLTVNINMLKKKLLACMQTLKALLFRQMIPV